MLTRTALALAGALLLAWVALLAALLLSARRHPAGARQQLPEALRLLPDTLRLLRRLAADPTVPSGVRLRLWLLLAYLALPIDLVPDAIPVIGYADDAIAVAAVLRSVTRRAGPAALQRHWPGTPAGLAALCHACGLPDPSNGDDPPGQADRGGLTGPAGAAGLPGPTSGGAPSPTGGDAPSPAGGDGRGG